ncbi:prenyltransferase/squalene oxidase repeat-containing protein [Streptomyces sp. BA2]|uniref:prenyltransferase/squalene oxidase repeat-containing protein n=1 Tax=Streptomyces sp. BA2 TaxID=436595 RepID=UPI00132A5E08|nr:prenyltransferase/squalene oxidase repeat-containing protein [Streptomyces sp. BA2]MWA15057.1 prenyltransferase [Streptomyces sp. BA2]
MTYEMLRRSSGVVSGDSDLWCTYAAVRTLTWLGRVDDLPSPETVTGFLSSRQNSDGGFAWSAGMSSDAWATYYCTQAMADLPGGGRDPVGGAGSAWVWSAAHADGGFAMTPGQASDVWATYYAVRTLVEIFGERPPEALFDWLSALQAKDGGLAWSPAHAKDGTSDVRACYYALTAWSTATGGQGPLPWSRERLTSWLKDRQSEAGGFTFQAGDDTDCLWATFRATSALSRLGETPRDPEACVAWIRARLTPGGSFTRWPGYPVPDVWAAFCGVGALRELGAGAEDFEDIADRVVETVLSFRTGQGGFTYRAPELASDVLTTSAHLIAGHFSDTGERDALRWTESCMLPNEDGIMYMPGRGSEVRCTLWALSAGAFRDDTAARGRIADWLAGSIQNPDGGFGYWEGRASDMVSTCAAAEILHRTGGESVAAHLRDIAGYVATCETAPGQYANVPGGRPTLRATLQALRALNRAVGTDGAPACDALALHRVRGGGFANEGNRVPDLLSTYEAVLAGDEFGLAWDAGHLTKFLDSVRTADGGFAWTPLMAASGGPLADCLGRRLEMRLSPERHALPPLALS